MQRIGAHLSISKGFSHAVEQMAAIGGNTLQIFSTSPRSWAPASVTQESIKAFQVARQQHGIDPVVFHASYLINLADDADTGRKSRQALIAELKLHPKLDIIGSVIHLGSFKTPKKPSLFDESVEEKKYQTLLHNITEILAETPEDSTFIIENDATKKICQSIDTIARIIDDLQNPRIKVCLDTCHLHAAGYALSPPDAYDSFMSDFDKKIGLDRLACIHLNDSKDPFASGRDRHANLGEGSVDESVFRSVLTDSRLASVPIILEVPGFDGEGPDKQNMDLAWSYAGSSV